MEENYDPAVIEPKWQSLWKDRRSFQAQGIGVASRPKFYVLDMFPYPSGKGLHVGHPRGYVASDVVARFKRMQAFDVLHPMGWDSFGLPTERQAERERIHPADITTRNVGVFRAQLESLGLSYDWSRELATSDPSYYKWTQWIFLKLYERDLAYLADVPVNWCPALNTVLANEEVRDGVYVETGDPVERRLMRQWMLRITAYAERLLKDLDLLDWPESLKEMQRNWIGKSVGARIRFRVANAEDTFDVYSTRPDTLFGCTFCVLAPEHPLVRRITVQAEMEDVTAYVNHTAQRSERDRISDVDSMTGVYTGTDAINPVNGQKIPIWISDYVIASHGTGAVFGCPAHDDRDFRFASKFGLPTLEVVSGGNVEVRAYLGDGVHINSAFLNGLNIKEANHQVITWLEAHGVGKHETQYALRDWLFSRQRYWGEPIPMFLLEDGSVKPVPERELPVLLPPALAANSAGTDLAPLAKAQNWVSIVDSDTGRAARRETNTMPQWAGSSWYFLRFADPYNDQELCSTEAEKRWLPVDLYIGGAEHATLHLLYARFWHKVLFDMGVVSSPEPFQRLFNQGMVLSQSFRDDGGKYYARKDVVERDGQWFTREGHLPLQVKVEKMSKSRYNGVAPEDIVAEYGADSLRIYEVFMGPLQDSVLWQTNGMVGVRRFLDRIWRLFCRSLAARVDFRSTIHSAVERELHRTIKKVTEDIEHLKLNTAISQLMIFVNAALAVEDVPVAFLDVFVRLLAPFAPHLAEELWSALGHSETIAFAPWPEFDLAKVVDDSVWVAVQINGKWRGRITLARNSSEQEARQAAIKDPSIQRHLDNQPIAKTFYVPDQLLNIVTVQSG